MPKVASPMEEVDVGAQLIESQERLLQRCLSILNPFPRHAGIADDIRSLLRQVEEWRRGAPVPVAPVPRRKGRPPEDVIERRNRAALKYVLQMEGQ